VESGFWAFARGWPLDHYYQQDRIESLPIPDEWSYSTYSTNDLSYSHN
jgi:hypothetical protein